MEKFDATTPAGRPLLSVDFVNLLPAGTTLSSCVVSIAVESGTDANPNSRLSGPAVIVGTVAAQFFQTGLVGVTYVLTFLGTFSNGEIEPVCVRITVLANV